MKHPDDSNFELIAKFENNPPTLSFIQSDYLTTNFQKTFMDFQVVDCKKKNIVFYKLGTKFPKNDTL